MYIWHHYILFYCIIFSFLQFLDFHQSTSLSTPSEDSESPVKKCKTILPRRKKTKRATKRSSKQSKKSSNESSSKEFSFEKHSKGMKICILHQKIIINI